MENKYIHYCWFGGKPLPDLAIKCLDSWKKYLPDYEIIRWDESNVDLEECSFVKGAYENKKWAFVSDYVRTKALYEYGGIYFDTDMEIVKPIDNLFECQTFLGVEDSGFVAVGVWYEKKAHSFLPEKLLQKYQSLTEFSVDLMSSLSIPNLLTNILKDYNITYGSKEIQYLEEGIVIYPRDYFYPYSFNRDNNLFSENTCMIHYYDATWLSKRQKLEMQMVRKLGKNRTVQIIKFAQQTKRLVRSVGKCILFPVVIYKRRKQRLNSMPSNYSNDIENVLLKIEKNNDKPYITIYNHSWLGVSSATKELFSYLIPCPELYYNKDIEAIANKIVATNTKQVIFSSFALGWKDLAIAIKKLNPSIKIKTFWHGSHSQILDSYGWQRNLEIIELHKKGIITTMATCKKSLERFYEHQGYQSMFLTNKVTLPNVKKRTVSKKGNEIRIGLYAAKCDDWRKNMYTQIAAASFVENASIDIVPLTKEAIEFANLAGIKVTGLDNSLSREKLIERMGKNDVNLYVTFSECAPMLPLESMEAGVPCIIGNNNHYFEEIKLKEYLVVDNEEDPLEIKNQINCVLKNKSKIMNLYQKFSAENKKVSEQQIKEFLER